MHVIYEAEPEAPEDGGAEGEGEGDDGEGNGEE